MLLLIYFIISFIFYYIFFHFLLCFVFVVCHRFVIFFYCSLDYFVIVSLHFIFISSFFLLFLLPIFSLCFLYCFIYICYIFFLIYPDGFSLCLCCDYIVPRLCTMHNFNMIYTQFIIIVLDMYIFKISYTHFQMYIIRLCVKYENFWILKTFQNCKLFENFYFSKLFESENFF